VSSALAIASVTAVMKNLLDNGLIDDQVTSTVGNVHVTALAPDLIPIDKNAESQLNLFLYTVTPNAAWRNEGLPSRDAQGDRRTNPPLALDLHYLVTAYASKDLHAEILLGYAMHLLHETAVLPRAGIRRALGVSGLIHGPLGSLPPELEALATSGLAEQVEAIKVTPDSVGPEELAKLWTGFQSRYRPSASYRVSVVLIEAQKSTRAPLPVRERRGYIVPFEEPVIDRVLAEATIGGPITADLPVLSRYRLVLRGRGLRGEVTLVRIGGQLVATDPSLVSDTQITVPLPAGLKAGIQSAQVVHDQLMGEPAVSHVGVASNLAPFVLHPEIVAPIATPVPGVIRVTIDPPVQEGQRVALLLNERVFLASPPHAARPRAYTFVPPLPSLVSPGGPLRDLDVPFQGVAPGEYLVRVAVDGAESPLGTDPLTGAYDRPLVTIP
jgi:hypothetical protein